MDNIFFNRMITPFEDAACGEADKPSGGGQDSQQGIVKKKAGIYLKYISQSNQKGVIALPITP
jgi:hypothetical protein